MPKVGSDHVAAHAQLCLFGQKFKDDFWILQDFCYELNFDYFSRKSRSILLKVLKLSIRHHILGNAS